MKSDKVAFAIRLSLNSALCLYFLGATVSAQTRSSGAQSTPNTPSVRFKSQLGKAKDEVIRAANDYKASLKNLLLFQEADVITATEMVEKRKALYAQNLVSIEDVTDGERLLSAAKAKVEETKKQMLESDDLIKETEAAESLSQMPQVKPKPRINSQKKAPLKKNQPAKRAGTCKGCMVI
jgi:hypothetical protein